MTLLGKLVLVNPAPSAVNNSSWLSAARLIMLCRVGCMSIPLAEPAPSFCLGLRTAVFFVEFCAMFLECEFSFKFLIKNVEESVGLAWTLL